MNKTETKKLRSFVVVNADMQRLATVHGTSAEHATSKLPILFRDLLPGEQLMSFQDWQEDQRFTRECLAYPMSDAQLFGPE